MDTFIRCHVKNQLRLNLLQRTIDSLKNHGLDTIGKLYLVDDSSPLESEVCNFAISNKLEYYRSKNNPDTKNGLYESLKLAKQNNCKFPILCTVDDMVVGDGILDILNDLQNFKDEYGTFGLFSIYTFYFRILSRIKFSNIDVWKVPVERNMLFCLVCHLFSDKLSDILIKEYDKFLNTPEKLTQNENKVLQCCDDIWVARMCLRENIQCYNTLYDYSQHTGMNQRSFGDKEEISNSNYASPIFVGE